MTVIKRLGILSVAKLYAVFAAAFGLAAGLIVGLVGSTASVGWGAVGWAAAILFPIGYAVGGFALGAFSAWLYNIVAAAVGGIEVELA